MGVKKISVAITTELYRAIEGIMIKKDMSRSRVIETLLRENPLVQKNIKLAALESRNGIFVAHRVNKIKVIRKHPPISA
jgi:metal-responsive CopG/Arc/MetJ family transcriptional regulator